MKRLPAFVVGHVLGAMVVGAVIGSFLELKAVVNLALLLGANAAINALICWWWPGFNAAWWKLWPMATFISPLMIAAALFTVDQWDCVVGTKRGWDCLLAGFGPLAMEACLPSPLVGLAARWWVRRRSRG
ncbi:MAG: hypothetical protein JOY64_28760 [Alphaproteobacteria bacterium]|nr:hypothetical protein [Alphaproteobacteria bacterium]MBV8411653.1 hypothetical protein [Alphaproteobacteria bacterium]